MRAWKRMGDELPYGDTTVDSGGFLFNSCDTCCDPRITPPTFNDKSTFHVQTFLRVFW